MDSTYAKGARPEKSSDEMAFKMAFMSETFMNSKYQISPRSKSLGTS
jgi:hypothetical protein